MNQITGTNNGLINGLSNSSLRPHAISIDNPININSWANLNSWTNTGPVTTSLSGGELTISGGTSDLLKYLTNTFYGTTNLMNWERTFVFSVSTLSATVDAVFIGIQENGTFSPRSMQATMIITTGANKGKVRIYKAGVQLVQSVGAVSFSLNDTIKYVLNRSGWTYTFSVYNLTTGADPIIITSIIDASSATNSLHWSGQFATYAFSGTQIIKRDVVTSSALKYAKTVCIGDSKTEGIGTSLFSNAYPGQLFSQSNTNYTICAKGNNLTQDVLNALHESLTIRGIYAILNIGRNDLSAGTAIATWKANYANIVTQLKNRGYKIVHLLPIPEITLDQSSLTTYIVSTYLNDFIVPTTGFNTATMLAADNIHPNTLGYLFISNQIKLYTPFVL